MRKVYQFLSILLNEDGVTQPNSRKDKKKRNNIIVFCRSEKLITQLTCAFNYREDINFIHIIPTDQSYNGNRIS